MAKRRILVIEDNPDNMILIQDMLESLHYEVIPAGNGQKGIELAATEVPDIIVMDLSLPIMDGWTAAHNLKADPALNHIPIIALTAHAMPGDRERALDSGCDAYLSKPINLPELEIVIGQFLG